jgi:hypothetical protein
MSTAALLIAGFMIFAVLMLAWEYRNRKEEEEHRGWRVRCLAAGRWAYEERKETGWVGITLEELGDHRESPHIIGVPAFPDWASARREEIVARLKSELKSPLFVLKDA